MTYARDHYEEYWQEAFECALDGEGLFNLVEQMTVEQRQAVGKSLRISQECMTEAFYVPENPLKSENERLARKLKWQRELESCRRCDGEGRLDYSAGPWHINTSCPHCSSSGKVHPHGEREPA